MIGVGFTLQPDDEFLTLTEPLWSHGVDYFEVAPETLWRRDAAGDLVPNGFHRRFIGVQSLLAKPFVAHGVGLSLSGDSPSDRSRTRTWLARIARDHAAFAFQWYSDHLGASVVDGAVVSLPLPMPMTAFTAALVRRQLSTLARVVPQVAVENTAWHFVLGDPLDEPVWLRRVVRDRTFGLVLDLHNLYTMAINLDFDPAGWLRRAPLDRVVEIHVSGGEYSDPRWLPDGRSVRLDSHDGEVPDGVWALLDRVLPRCPNARGVTLERMEGSVSESDVPVLRSELARIHRAIESVGRS